uniref:Uncharacterized protein n=1 Tax=Arundo donax TaxID=35708 RepID=A0A0A9F2H6_ARUDO
MFGLTFDQSNSEITIYVMSRQLISTEQVNNLRIKGLSAAICRT